MPAWLSTHLSDEELLLFVDREMPAQRRGLVSEHLGQCLSCAHRKAALEKTLSLFAEIHEEGISSGPGAAFSARSALKTRLAAARKERPAMRPVARQVACAAIALLIVGVSGVGLHTLQQRGARSKQQQLAALPSKALTPGAVRAVRLEELCSEQTLDNDPPVDASVAQAVFREYGLGDSSTHAYALDYLIAPTLGGTSDIKNLWPQPYTSQWNAQLKDQLENHLHTLVCQRRVDLTTAQTQMATNWIAAYQQYFPPLVRVAQVSPSRSGFSHQG
jgi:hypothetical protein